MTDDPAAARPSLLPHRFRLGTRGSPLALTQARMVAAALAACEGQGAQAYPLAIIRTTGDATQGGPRPQPLSDIGGKGLFTKEIDEAQLGGAVDLAVHSAKDLPTALPEGLVIAGFLPRADVRDALVSPDYLTLAALPKGARLGTISLRRQAQVRRVRPDLVVEPLRGNVETRIARVREGGFAATLLAYAGLSRLGHAGAATEILPEETFLPAIGQGAVAIVARADDAAALAAVAAISDAQTGVALAAERAFLAALDGSCRTPIAGLARVSGGTVHLRGAVLKPDGTDLRATEGMAPLADAARLGAELGAALHGGLPPGFLSA